MYGWIIEIFYKLKGFMKNPIFSSSMMYVLIGVGMLYVGFYIVPKLMNGLGFMSEKEKLLVKTTSQESLIKTLQDSNSKLIIELQQCDALNKITKEEVQNVITKTDENKKEVNKNINDKNDKIDKIVAPAKPNEKIVYEDKTITIPKAKLDAVSKIQIDSLWSEYEKVISK